jgi:hypothetical protein
MISPKFCPHCLKRIPWRRRLKPKCPFCIKPFRRRSTVQERSVFAHFLEDRGVAFWFFQVLIVTVLLAIIFQISGHPTLIRFIDARTGWFVISIYWTALYATLIGRMHVPLLLGAPKILRRERAIIRQYKRLTQVGVLIGIPFALLFVGTRYTWERFPGLVFLLFVPVSLMWAYQALTLTAEDYEDERVWSYLQELGAQDRLEHRHNAYFVLIGLPLAGLLFYYFMTHPWLARAIKESAETGIISMLVDLWHRIRGTEWSVK